MSGINYYIHNHGIQCYLLYMDSSFRMDHQLGSGNRNGIRDGRKQFREYMCNTGKQLRKRYTGM